jgi:VWFA-related protein
MFRGARCRCFLLLVLLISVAASAQQQDAHSQPDNAKIYLDVVVTPNSGSPVADLQQQDFALFDNDAPQTITSFRAVTGRQAAIGVILVIDAINATYQTVSYERNEINKFLRAEGGQLLFPVAVVALKDQGVQIVADYSSDGNALSAALDREDSTLRAIGRTSGYYGAVERWQSSLNALRQLVAGVPGHKGRTIMVWVSPGWPLLSGPGTALSAKQQQQIFADIVSLSNGMLQRRVTVYSVDPLGSSEPLLRASSYQEFLKGIGKFDQAMIGNLGLPVLAVQSGGLALYSNNDVAGLLRSCTIDAAPFYEISFALPPAGHADEYHRLEVRVAKPGLIARTHQGYYAAPSAHD